MTQDELDSIMEQGVDSLSFDSKNADTHDVSSITDSGASDGVDDEIKAEFIDPATYKPRADKKWPPPPPTEEHKVVHQLDDVTRDSEVKMSEVFDQVDAIGSYASKIEKGSKKLIDYLKTQEKMLLMLVDSFPKIKAFSTSLEQTKSIKDVAEDIKNLSIDCNDACMQTMDIMQYQDIHRQKIERVINVMRALSQYMNSLFEGSGDDSKRASSATFIAGDNHDDVASEGDIEALIASFGKK